MLRGSIAQLGQSPLWRGSIDFWSASAVARDPEGEAIMRLAVAGVAGSIKGSIHTQSVTSPASRANVYSLPYSLFRCDTALQFGGGPAVSLPGRHGNVATQGRGKWNESFLPCQGWGSPPRSPLGSSTNAFLSHGSHPNQMPPFS